MESSPFRPFQTTYYDSSHQQGGAESSSALDFVLYVPHGARAKDFLDQHSEIVEASWLTREKLEQICDMEADLFTPELAKQMAQELAAKGYRVAVTEVFTPREIVDVNRDKDNAVHAFFDHEAHPDIRDRLLGYYDQVLAERKRLLGQLGPNGKWIDVHSMRPFSTKMDSKPPPKGKEKDEMVDYYTKRIEALQDRDNDCNRTHCLVIRYQNNGKTHEAKFKDDHLIGDPVLIYYIESLFKKHGVSYNDDVYAFLNHVLGSSLPEQYENGIVLDIDKRALAKDMDQFDLLHLEADAEKIKRLGGILNQALVQAKECPPFLQHYIKARQQVINILRDTSQRLYKEVKRRLAA